MFNPFFRSFLPGFLVEPDDVPGFNIDDNGLPRRANASFDGTFPDSATQQYSNAAQTQSSPSISFRLPGAEGYRCVLSRFWLYSPNYRNGDAKRPGARLSQLLGCCPPPRSTSLLPL